MYVVEDTSGHLVTYLPEGAEIGFVDGDWPTPDGKHPWHAKTHFIGYDTQDFELDIVVSPDGSYVVKDLEVLDDRVTEGRFTPELVTWIRDVGAQLGEQLDAGNQWWDPEWAAWVPPAGWRDAEHRRQPGPGTTPPPQRGRSRQLRTVMSVTTPIGAPPLRQRSQ